MNKEETKTFRHDDEPAIGYITLVYDNNEKDYPDSQGIRHAEAVINAGYLPDVIRQVEDFLRAIGYVLPFDISHEDEADG